MKDDVFHWIMNECYLGQFRKDLSRLDAHDNIRDKEPSHIHLGSRSSSMGSQGLIREESTSIRQHILPVPMLHGTGKRSRLREKSYSNGKCFSL